MSGQGHHARNLNCRWRGPFLCIFVPYIGDVDDVAVQEVLEVKILRLCVCIICNILSLLLTAADKAS